MGYEQPPGYRIPMQMPTIGKGVPDAVALQIWANWQAKYAPQMDFNALRIQARAARAWHPGARMREQDIIFHLKARDAVMALADALEAAAIENAELRSKLEPATA